MNKAELADSLATKAGISKANAAAYVNFVVDSISETLTKGEKVTISDFGTFEVSTRKAFVGHNPKSGGAINVPQRKIPTFRAGKGLKASMNA